jgi:hypothetical protein
MQVVIAGGVEHKVNAHLPLEFDASAARNLIEQAVQLAPVVKPAQECDWKSGEVEPRLEEWLKGLRTSFAFTRQDDWLSISQTADGLDVESGGNLLKFALDAADPTRFYFRCWEISEEIVVT